MSADKRDTQPAEAREGPAVRVTGAGIASVDPVELIRSPKVQRLLADMDRLFPELSAKKK